MSASKVSVAGKADSSADKISLANDLLQFTFSRENLIAGSGDSYSSDDDDFDDNIGDLHSLQSALTIVKGAGGGGQNIAVNENKINLSARIQNDITTSEKKGERRVNNQGRDDRATTEQVLDPRTRLILFKMMSNGFLSEIDGCLSTGKEANVYYARGTNGEEYAVKIFKTSILVFKDRDKYVSGEFRFKQGYCKSNPRKMVKTWAEKEMRNLKRLQSGGIPSPQPHLLKAHVLIMDFLGKDGWCSPRLKDVELSLDEYFSCYQSIIINMWKLYHDCKLVHGDLSEYNILWHKNKPFIIDVSQSVEHSHPFSTDFLRKDIQNVNDYFGRKGLAVLSNSTLYRFISSLTLVKDKEAMEKAWMKENDVVGLLNPEQLSAKTALVDEYLMSKLNEFMDQAQEDSDDSDGEAIGVGANSSGSGATNSTEEAINVRKLKAIKSEIEESVFLHSYIPTTLDEIANPHMEVLRMKKGLREPAFVSAVASMIHHGNSSSSDKAAEIDSESDNEGSRDGSGSSSDNTSDSDNEGDKESDGDGEDNEGRRDRDGKYSRRLPAHEKEEDREKEKQLRKEAKKQAKLEQAEKRKTKIPKHVKKRAMKSKK